MKATTIKGLVCVLITLCIWSPHLHGQQISINSSGDTILTFPDKSWRYFVPSDSIYAQVQVSGPVLPEINEIIESISAVDSYATFKSDHKAFQKHIAKLQKLGLNTLSDTVVLSVLEKINHYLKEQTSILTTKQDQIFLLESHLEELELSKLNASKAAEDYNQLKREIKSLKKNIKSARKQIKQLEKQVQYAKQLKDASIEYQHKWIAKYERKHGSIQNSPVDPQIVQVAEITATQDPVLPKEKKSIEAKIDTSKKYYSPTPVTPTNYDHFDCQIAFEGRDEFSNKRRIDVQKQTLFEFTHDELKPYFKDKIYVTCEGWLSAQPGFKYLTLEFSIASDRARHSFGELQRGAIITLKLIDGSFINLINTNQDYGTVDIQNKMTYYRGQYVIDKRQERELTSKELDQIRVTWTSGYEDYDIFEMDFLINQFSCLNSVY